MGSNRAGPDDRDRPGWDRVVRGRVRRRAAAVQTTLRYSDPPIGGGREGCSSRERTKEEDAWATNAARKKITNGRTVWKARSGEPGSSAKTSVWNAVTTDSSAVANFIRGA